MRLSYVLRNYFKNFYFLSQDKDCSDNKYENYKNVCITGFFKIDKKNIIEYVNILKKYDNEVLNYTYDMENPKYLGKYQLDGKIDTKQPFTMPATNFDHIYGVSRRIQQSTA